MVGGLRRRSTYNARREENILRREYSEEEDEERRKFSHKVKEGCWKRAALVKGRDPERWRRDALGNLVFRKLSGCKGCLCYDFDHIVPFSKGGKSSLDNCQVLQSTVNQAKGNRENVSVTQLVQSIAHCRLSERDMDLIELSAYGDVRKEHTTNIGGCRIQ